MYFIIDYGYYDTDTEKNVKDRGFVKAETYTEAEAKGYAYGEQHNYSWLTFAVNKLTPKGWQAHITIDNDGFWWDVKEVTEMVSGTSDKVTEDKVDYIVKAKDMASIKKHFSELRTNTSLRTRIAKAVETKISTHIE